MAKDADVAPFEDQGNKRRDCADGDQTAIPIYCMIMTCRVRYFGSAKPMRAKRSSILEEANSTGANPMGETRHMIRRAALPDQSDLSDLSVCTRFHMEADNE